MMSWSSIVFESYLSDTCLSLAHERELLVERKRKYDERNEFHGVHIIHLGLKVKMLRKGFFADSKNREAL